MVKQTVKDTKKQEPQKEAPKKVVKIKEPKAEQKVEQKKNVGEPVIAAPRIYHCIDDIFNGEINVHIANLKEKLNKEKHYSDLLNTQRRTKRCSTLQKKRKNKEKLTDVDAKFLEEYGNEDELNEKELNVLEYCKNEIKKLSETRVRIGKNAPKVLSKILTKMVEDILRRVMDNAVVFEKKVTKNRHMFLNQKTKEYTYSPEDMELYPLFQASNVLSDALDEIATSYHNFESESESDEKKEEMPDQSNLKNEETSKKIFAAYVDKIYKNIKASDAKYAELRISKKLKHFLSDLCNEVINRLCVICGVLIGFTKVKTISKSIVLISVEILMRDGERDMNLITKLLA